MQLIKRKFHLFIQAINWIINIGIISIISICFYRLNQITGYAGDDFLYHFLYHGEWPTKHISAIHNVFEWIQSVINQTQMWNGRFIAQGLVQLFMQFPKEIFNIANTIAFIAVGLLINLLVRRRIRDVNPIYLLLTYCAMCNVLLSSRLWTSRFMAFRKFQLSLDTVDLSWILLVFTLAVYSAKTFRNLYLFNRCACLPDWSNK